MFSDLFFDHVHDLLFVMAVETAPDGGVAFRCARVNDAYLTATGLAREAVVGRTVEQILPPAAAGYASMRYGQAIAAREPITYAEDVTLPAGRLHVETTLTPVFDPATGRCTFLLGAARDVTDRRRAEAALAESERHFRGVLETARSYALTLDAAGRVTFANDALCAALGWTRDELAGADWFARCVPDGHAAVGLFRAAVRTGALVPHYENEVVSKGGARRLVAWDNTVLRDAEGRVVGTASLGQDVTERRLLEARLRRAERLEAVGLLASGVAHNFNNLLTAARGNLDLLEAEASLARGDPEAAACLGDVRDAVDRAAALVRQLTAFAGGQATRPAAVDVNVVVEDVQRLLERLLDGDGRLVLDLAPGAAVAVVDPAQLEQVLMNLAVNARDALRARALGAARPATLTLRTRRVALGTPLAHAHGTVPPGRYVVVAAEDTGAGMPREVLGRAFEPFFTTKPRGQGTGLGLATVHGIVQRAGGAVVVESALDVGARLTCYLPAADRPADGPEATSPARARQAGSARSTPEAPNPSTLPNAPADGMPPIALVVAADAAVRAAAAWVLGRAGWDVRQGGNARDAHLQYEMLRAAHGASARAAVLLVCDVELPDADGPALARELAARVVATSAQPLAVLFVSTHARAHPRLSDTLLGGSHACVTDPFTAAGLLDAVGRALARAGHPPMAPRRTLTIA